jgi:methylenetetrahydrofolate--tRNA-(uracil-5-)-methyltransferase
VIVATGPLTSRPLADAIRELTDENALAFFDAIAPIVHKDSIDMSVAWFQSRYDKVGPGGTGADYINCPMTKEQYDASLRRCWPARKVDFKDWETTTPYFDGCLPVEVMAERGHETLRHGPMKPVGLTNPHNPTVKPYAIVQLRPGQQARHALQHRRLPDQAELRRAAARVPHHSRPRERRFRPARRPASQHLPELAKAARWAVAAARAAKAALRRPDDRLRGLCGIRQHRPDRRASMPRRRTGAVARTAAVTTALGSLLGHITGGHIETIRGRNALIPADEHQFRTVPAAGQPADQEARRHKAARQREDGSKKAGAQRPGAADLDRWIADHLRVAAAA